MSTVDVVERVRRRLAAAGGTADPATIAEAVRQEAGGVVGHADVLDALHRLDHEFTGAGPLEPLLRKETTTDVLVTAPSEVWVDGPTGLHRTDITFPDEDAVRRLAQRLAMAAGRRLDDASPYVDGWLPGTGPHGRVRLHAVLPPIAADGTCISLRVLRPASHDLTKLIDLGTLDHELADLIHNLVVNRVAFLISGATGSGKTTLLAALLARVPATERIVAIEDAGELQPNHPQFIRLVARPSNVEGAGAVTVRDLVREALRMRPDRLVVGEVRGAEVRELLTALNTGHDGGAGTVHANSPAEVPARLEALAALGGLTGDALHSQLSAAVRVVLHMRRTSTGTRHLSEIAVLHRPGDRVHPIPAWRNGTWLTAEADLRALAHK